MRVQVNRERMQARMAHRERIQARMNAKISLKKKIPGSKDCQRLGAIFVLRTLVGTLNCNARRYVRHAHRTLRCVDCHKKKENKMKKYEKKNAAQSPAFSA